MFVDHSESGTGTGDIFIPFMKDVASRQNEVHACLLHWLISRNVEVRDNDGSDRLLPMLVPTDETSVKKLKNLIALLSTDHEDLSETIPDTAITFAMAILPPQWSSSSTSYVFYRDDPGYINGDCVLLQRVQKAKKCFIQARPPACYRAVSCQDPTDPHMQALSLI